MNARLGSEPVHATGRRGKVITRHMLVGLGLMQLARRAWPSLICVLTLGPALMVVISGRDVDALNLVAQYDADSFYTLMGRLGTVTVLVLAVLVVLFGPQKRRLGESRRNHAWPLLAALIAYLLGASLAPSLFGAVPDFDLTKFYAFAVLFAAYAARRLSTETFFLALRISLLVLMIAGLLTIVLAPALSVHTTANALRLPVLGFRFWGLGSNPNNIGPLALLLLLVTIHSPFKYRAMTLLAWGAALVTIILSQSVTTWIATMLVVPLFALYSYTPKPIRKARISPALAVLSLMGLSFGLSLLIWEIAHFDFSNLADATVRIESDSILSYDKSSDTGMFSGRTELWEIAIDTWKAHPWFGYGPSAWDIPFRTSIGMPNAFHAHNQIMQAVSVGGWVALIALSAYLLVLISLSVRSFSRSNGLSMALLIVLLIRGFSEGPLETATLMSGEVLYQTVLVFTLAGYLSARQLSHQKARRRRSHRRSVNRVASVHFPTNNPRLP